MACKGLEKLAHEPDLSVEGLRADSPTSPGALATLAFDGISGFACYRTVEETYATAASLAV